MIDATQLCQYITSSGGYTTHAQFKKAQLDLLIDIILEANSDADDAYHHIADEYLARNVQDYINIEKDELDTMIITKTESNDPIDLPMPQRNVS